MHQEFHTRINIWQTSSLKLTTLTSLPCTNQPLAQNFKLPFFVYIEGIEQFPRSIDITKVLTSIWFFSPEEILAKVNGNYQERKLISPVQSPGRHQSVSLFSRIPGCSAPQSLHVSLCSSDEFSAVPPKEGEKRDPVKNLLQQSTAIHTPARSQYPSKVQFG